MAGKSSYTKTQGDSICALLVEGKSLRTICELDEMPSVTTVMNWLGAGERGEDAQLAAFLEQYTRAREAQADTLFDEIVDIADNSTDDVIFLTLNNEEGESGRPAIKHSAIARAKLQIDARKWVAGKLRPKKYGDKQQIEQRQVDKDGNDLNPDMSDDELNRRIAALIQKV